MSSSTSTPPSPNGKSPVSSVAKADVQVVPDTKARDIAVDVERNAGTAPLPSSLTTMMVPPHQFALQHPLPSALQEQLCLIVPPNLSPGLTSGYA
eukprot:1372109-Rhodomonas_salina.3